MKRWISIGLSLFAFIWATEGNSGSRLKTLFYEDLYGSRAGITQFYDVLAQLARAMGDIPPDMERLAVYFIRVDRSEYTAGMARFIQGKIEETFIKYGRKQIITAPELRNMRIVSTDSSFLLSNTLPSQEDLWRIGEKLRVDGFIEGSLTRSEVGDVILNLKVFRHKTAEVVWSGSFIAGPNEQKMRFPLLELGARLGYGYWPVDRFTNASHVLSGNALKMDMYHYYAELTVGEAANSLRRLYLSAAGGLGVIVPVLENPRDTILDEVNTYYTAMAGADLLYVFVPKANNDDGWWLGAYLGVRAYLPQKLMVLRHGYSSRVTHHFTISGGVQIMPLIDQLIASKSLFSSSEYEIKLKNPTYEISIQYAY